MFNWFYAFIGVCAGYSIITNIDKSFKVIIVVGFLIFSASFGLEWLLVAIGEIIVGVVIGGFIDNKTS